MQKNIWDTTLMYYSKDYEKHTFIEGICPLTDF